MSKQKPGLGRGLDALINPRMKEDINSSVTVPSDKINSDDGESVDIIAKIPVNLISPNPFQPRNQFEPAAIEELKKSILENGLIQPITVRRIDGGKYQLISGERRLRACKDIGFRELPAYIVKVDTNEAMLALALIENIQREELNAIEVAEAYKRLIDDCKLSQEQVAEKVGKDRTTVTNAIRLLKLSKLVQEALIKKDISAGHARALINLPNEDVQTEVLRQIIKEQLSVRKVEALVKNYNNLTKSPSKKHAVKNDLDSIAQRDVESRLRGIFGTKVLCKQKKDGSGQITLDFYSNDELERLFELFDIIEKNNY